MPTVIICLLFIFIGGDAMAAETNLAARNKEAVRRAFEKWTEGTGSPFDLLAPEAKWTIVGNAPVSRTYTSRQEFLEIVIKPFNARMQQRLIPKVRAIYSDGDMVIALFDAEAVALDGKPYRNTYTWYMRMDDEKIVEAIAFFDTIEFIDLWTRITPQ
jgi:ketosteroid isomerase-like protein